MPTIDIEFYTFRINVIALKKNIVIFLKFNYLNSFIFHITVYKCKKLNNKKYIIRKKKKNESLLYFPPQYFTFISNIYSRFNNKSVFRY